METKFSLYFFAKNKFSVSTIDVLKLFLMQLVMASTATIVCLNKDYRPTRVFPEMSAKLHRFFSSNDG
jgi:hypothetical protein